jgi:hypothetical protein
MRIRLRRSGGFAGLQAPPVEIDSQQLPADKARELEQLVTQARLFEQPAAAAASQPAGSAASSQPAGSSPTQAVGSAPAQAAGSTPTQAAGSGPSLPPAPAPGLMRDGFQYDLSVEDGGRSQAVRLHEGAMHPEAARLVKWLAQEGRGMPPKG